MKNIFAKDNKTIRLKVKNKVVTIQGSSTNHNDVLELEAFAQKQVSVQQVIRDVKYPSLLLSKNNKKAKALEAKIKLAFDDVKKLKITIYGEYAEVLGLVEKRSTKLAIHRFLLTTLAVRKVVNKILAK